MSNNAQLTVCQIEHHATLFALLARQAVTRCGEAGKAAILDGMTIYGKERGARIAKAALAHGDELNVITNQAYGEWVPGKTDHMEAGFLRTEPTLQTYVTRCPWCDAWKKHNLLEYGKLYCINVDKAVYHGFHPDFECKILSRNLSFGGTRCEFDWGFPLTAEDLKELDHKKQELGTSCTKDFTFHTAHLLHTVGNTLRERLGESGSSAVNSAVQEFIELFGAEYYESVRELLAANPEF